MNKIFLEQTRKIKKDEYQRAGDWFMEFFENYDSYNTSLRVGTRWWQSVGDTTWAKCANVSCGGSAGLGVVNVGGLKVAGQNGDPTSKLAWEGQKVLAHEVFVDYEIERFKFRGVLGIKELSKGRGGNIRDWDWVVDTLHDYDLNDTDDWVAGTGNTLLYSDTESPLEDLDTNYIQLDFGYSFDLANFFLKDLIKKNFFVKFQNLDAKFKKSEFIYLLIYRFVGGIPFAISNILPCIFNVKINNFFWATFIGMLPQLFILTTIASGLEKIIDQNLEAPGIIEIITNPAIYYPLMIFACLIILTIFLRKIFYKS